MSGERNRMRRLALLITPAVSTGGLGIFPARPACASDVYEGGTTPVVVTENSKILAYGGRSRIGDSTRMNEITLSGTYDDVYGGWTTGTGTDKADRNDSHNNKLIFAGGAAVNIYRGCTESDGGKAYGNTVFFIKTGAADPHAHYLRGPHQGYHQRRGKPQYGDCEREWCRCRLGRTQ